MQSIQFSFQRSVFFPLVAGCLLLLYSCDKGLAPVVTTVGPGGKTALSGTIHFAGGKDAWPPKDSVVSMRVVAFISYPPTNIFSDVISGKAFFTDTLATFADSVSYTLTLDTPQPPAQFAYIVVAQQYGSDFTKDWRVIGVYTLSGDKTQPSTLMITPGKLHEHIDMNVDFAHLPPQPF